MYIGDFILEETIYFKFTTRRFTTGVPFALASGVLSCYEDNSTTQITAGITLTADFDSVAGLNHVTIVAAAADGYEAGKQYDVVITTGTVDSVSVVGEVVGRFSLGAVSTYTRLGAPAGASVSADIAAVKVDTAAILVDTGTTLDGRIPAALVSGRIDASVGAMAANVITAAATAVDFSTEVNTAPLAILGTPAGASMSADIAAAKTVVDAVKAKTDNLPSDPADASVVAGLIAAAEAKIDIIDTNVDSVLADTGTDGVVVATGSKTGYAIGAGGIAASAFAAGAIDAASLAADAGTELGTALLDLANGIETGIPLRKALRAVLASLAGKLSGAATTTVTIRDASDSKDVIIATVDADGNRTAITLDLT